MDSYGGSEGTCRIDFNETWDMFIGGEFRSATSGDYLQEFDPRTGKPGFRVARGGAADVDQAVINAQSALPGWRDLKPLDRGRILIRIGTSLRARLDEFARAEQCETGKPLPQSRGDLEATAQYFELYGGLAAGLEGECIDVGPKRLCYTRREPYGTVGVILPWNAPINQAGRGIAPALAAGNTVVAKPSRYTSVSSLMLAELAVACGLPPGALNVVTGSGTEVGMPLVRHPLVAKICFTGSGEVGREIGHVAAERIIPVTLELGGKSPDIVFADADVEAAVKGVMTGFTSNAGQACIAGTRCLVERSLHDRFVTALAEEVRQLKVGAEDDCAIGPMITEAQFNRVNEYFAIAVEEGATLLVGGARAEGSEVNQGWFVQPTVYTNVQPGMRIAREEIFGPVCVVMAFDDEEDAISLANNTEYGLAAGLWTRDIGRAHRVAARLQAGQIFINEYPATSVETPFGGYKESGIGREKGREALYHYTQLKTVILKL